jgi:hypothetical protein
MTEIDYFLKILKHQNPNYFSEVRITTEVNIMVGKYEIVISFPGNSGNLYPDISFYIRFVWGTNVFVIAEFDSDGTNHFKFTE